MESFQELGLPAFLGESLKRMNFVKPTPVQAQAIPAALEGKDVIASAQTGTGKTGAFGIPLLNFLFNNPGQTALILTPTRELAVQVLEVLRKLTGTNYMGGSVLLIGGANMGAQLSALNRKPRLFIGTPGRVIDHLQRGSLNLSQAGFLVLDEADRMLDMGFAPQLEEIRKRLPAKRQTLLFSATIPSNIQSMGARFLKDPVRITVGETSQPISKIRQMVIHTSEAKKPEELVNELNERQGSVLIFARMQSRVDRIAERLKEQGFKVTRIHGGRSQSQRRQAIDHFREGHYRILVATDIAARGLDIHHIAHVINYDLPRNPEDYIHRVGRTARAGAEGQALCFLTSEDRGLWDRILKLIKAPKDSIQVKGSKFGDFTPRGGHGGRESRGPKQHTHPGAPRRPVSRSFNEGRNFSEGGREGHQGHRPGGRHERGGAPAQRGEHRGPKPFTPGHSPRPSFEEQRHDARPVSRSFNEGGRSHQDHSHRPPQRSHEGPRREHQPVSDDSIGNTAHFVKPAETHSRPHSHGPAAPTQGRPPFKKEGGSPGGFRPPFEKHRHPEGRHQKRSEEHMKRQGLAGAERTPFDDQPTFNRPPQGRPQGPTDNFDDEKQPMDNRSAWEKKSFGGGDRPFVPRTNRPQRPGFRPGGGSGRPHRPGVMTSHSGERPFSSGRPSGGEHRPHRSGPGGRPGFSKDSRPGGHFKKSGFRPKPH